MPPQHVKRATDVSVRTPGNSHSHHKGPIMKRTALAILAIVGLGLPTFTASTSLAATAKTKPAAAAKKQPLGDISKFRTITADTLGYAQTAI